MLFDYSCTPSFIDGLFNFISIKSTFNFQLKSSSKNKIIKYIILAIILSSVVIIASFFLRKKTIIDKEKTTPFECGFDPYLITRTPFSLRFFKIAIIFLIFDIEIVLILPLPLLNRSINTIYITSRLIIIIIILRGLLYEWQQGSLDWMK